MYILNKEKSYYVYMYTSPSGKSYVGRSCNSKNIRARTDGSGYKNCTAFWNAIQKYGWENFIYRILEENIGYEDIDKRENYWINYYSTSTDENGYNLLKPEGEGKTYTDEVIKKLSDSHKGQTPWNKGLSGVYSEEALKKMSDSHIGKMKGEKSPLYGKHLSEETKEKLRQYRGEKSSMFGKHHTEETKKKISLGNMGHPGLVGEKNPMYGKHLSEEAKEKISKKLKGKFAGEKNPMYGVHLLPSEETRRKLSAASSVAVSRYDLKGNYVCTYKSCKEAAEAVSGSARMISACCCGSKKSHKGFQWCKVGKEETISEYKSNEYEQRPIVQILNGGHIRTFKGVNEANRFLGKTGSNISSCLHGKLKSAYGYQWEYLSQDVVG